MVVKETIKIPREWRMVRLGDVTSEPQYGYTTRAVSKGRIKLLRTTDITKGKVDWDKVPYCKDEPEDIEKYLIKDGDIVISRAGSIGFSYLIENPPNNVVFASYLIRFIPFINKKYFKYFLNSQIYWNQVEEKESGIAIPNINATKLKNMLFVLSPLPEQQKIVEILNDVFSKIEAGVEDLKKIKSLLSLYRQAVLKYAFEGKLTEEWREQNKDKLEPAEKLIEKIKKEREERYKQKLEEWKRACEIAKKEGKKKPPKPKPPKELPPITEEELKNLPDIPKEWKWVRLGEVGTVYSGGTPYTKVPSYWGDEIPWITPADLSGYKHKYISKGKKSITKLGLENSSAVLMPAGTVLFSSRAPIGYVAIASNPVSTNQGFKSIYPYKTILSDFIYYYLKFAKEIIENMGSGTTFKEVSAKVFNLIPFPLLSLSEQQKIVEEIEYRLSIADNLEGTVDKLLEKAEKLKQSYLKYAFEGKLTEEWRKQNPHLITGENSVDKLIEKIKAEKEKFEKQKKEAKKNQRKKKMKEKPKNLSILEVLEANGGEMDSKEVWKASKYSDNIEKFYEELKELYLNNKIEEQKNERGSILRLKR